MNAVAFGERRIGRNLRGYDAAIWNRRFQIAATPQLRFAQLCTFRWTRRFHRNRPTVAGAITTPVAEDGDGTVKTN